MLKSPPGLDKRRESSEVLDQAGAVFEDLYKKYLTLDNENLQKRAETYLLKSFCNKQTFKNFTNKSLTQSNSGNLGSNLPVSGPGSPDFRSNSGDFMSNSPDAQVRNSTQLSPEEPDLSPKIQSSGPNAVTQDYVKQVSFETDHMKMGAKLVSKSPPKNAHSNPKFPPEDTESIWANETITPSKLNTNKLNSKLTNSKPNSKLSNTRLTKSNRLKPKNATVNKIPKDKTKSKDDTRIFVDNLTESDISEESVSLDESSGHVVTLKEYDHSPCFDKVEEYLMGSQINFSDDIHREINTGGSHGGLHSHSGTLLSRNKELNFICGLSILFQIFMCFNVFGLFFLLHSFQYEFHSIFFSIALPFLLHFSMFYLVFTIGVSRVKKSLLIYTSDITIEILNKRLNRQLNYNKLTRVCIGAERIFVLLALGIACIPVKFSADLTQLRVTESLYISFNVVYAVLQILFCFYYFKVLFKKILTLSD